MLSSYQKIEVINEVLGLGAISCKVKLLEEPPLEGWTDYLGLPTPSYFEPFGPYLIRDLEWIMIDPVERKKIGRLIPEKILDHTDEISRIFMEKGLDYRIEDFYFKVSF